MKTAFKRIIAAVAVFGALSALHFNCLPLHASAVNLDGVLDKDDQELYAWCLDELNITYQIYRTGPVPAAAIQKLQALVYASAVSLGRSIYSRYEPDFEGNLTALYTGFYFDSSGNIHVTDVFAGRDRSKQQKTHLVLASDEHWTTFSGLYDIGTNQVTGYGVRDSGSPTLAAFRLITYINNSQTYGYNIVTNDDGDSVQWFGDNSLEVNIQRPAAVCNAFPPADYVNFIGYLPITDESNNTVPLRGGYDITESDFETDLDTFVNNINNYIANNYPSSDVVVPTPEPIETLPNDEYSGLPAGWNEINPVSLPDIDTPSLPVDGSEDFAESIDGLQFLSAFRDGLGFWARSVSWVCDQFPLAARVLLALGLLGLLAFIFWRWSL